MLTRLCVQRRVTSWRCKLFSAGSPPLGAAVVTQLSACSWMVEMSDGLLCCADRTAAALTTCSRGTGRGRTAELEPQLPELSQPDCSGVRLAL